MEENKGQKIYKIIMLVFLTALITFILTTIIMYNSGGKIKYISLNQKNSELESKLNNYKTLIDKYYLGNVSEQNLVDGAIKGYVEGLGDPYSQYFTKNEMEDFKEDISGNFEGIGIYLVKDEEKNIIKILAPIKDTPAYKAGLLPGDIISKVNGKSYTGDELDAASDNIKGKSGTKVSLEVIRNSDTLNFEIQREKIKINHVESKSLANNIGYLKLSTFDEGCSTEFKQKYEELVKNNNITSLIIDLRNNGGGIVGEALQIADYMTDKNSTLLITVDKNNKEVIEKAKQNKLINMTIIVLTNEYSASASEILAGALKDNKVAKIVGTKTYGKGVIQTVLTLDDGSGLKLTIEEYYTPNRNKINKLGIDPDVNIQLPKDLKNSLEIDDNKDTQLQKAIELLK